MDELGCSHNAHFQYLEVSKELTVLGDTKFTSGISNPTGLLAPTITEKKQMVNGQSIVMIKNTHYLTPVDGSTITASLPHQSDSTTGDVIIVEYHNAIAACCNHQYGTNGEQLMPKSAVYVPVPQLGGVLYNVIVANNNHEFLILESDSPNSGPGIGSYVVFTFNGSKWRVEGRILSSGTGEGKGFGVPNTSRFS